MFEKPLHSDPVAGSLEDAALFSIPGLDANGSLQRLRGRKDLYYSILRKFIDIERDFPSRIESELSLANWPVAERTAHSLKGAAAMIGATDLLAHAKQLDLAIRAHQPGPVLDACVADLGHCLAQLIDALCRLLSYEPPTDVHGHTAP